MGVMPPWFLEKDVGIQAIKDDMSLTEEEIATIAAWVDGGAPRGNPEDMPPPETGLTEDRYVKTIQVKEVGDSARTIGGRFIYHITTGNGL